MKEFTENFIGDEIKGTVKRIKLNWEFKFRNIQHSWSVNFYKILIIWKKITNEVIL